MEFNKLLKDLPDEKVDHPRDYHLIVEQNEFLSLVEDLRRAKRSAIDLETTSPYPMWADLVGVSLSHTPGQAFYIPVGHQPREGVQQLSLRWVLEQLKPLLEDEALKKVGQNIIRLDRSETIRHRASGN